MKVALGFALCLLAAPVHAQDVSFAIHGQHRLVYRYSDPEDLGIPSANGAALARASESLQLLRNTVQAELGYARFRGVLELGGWYALGDTERARPPDEDLGDVALAFAEWSNGRVRARVGRQELPLGSTRWFSIRDGANLRQSLDLLRLTFTFSRAAIDAFAGSVVRQKRGWFDDLPSTHDPLLGMYSSLSLAPAKLLTLDLYLLHRQRAPGEGHFAGDKRTTFGLSVGGESHSGAEYIQHTLVQVGSRDEVHYLAWALSAAFWQRLPVPLDLVRLGLRLDALSGDRHAQGRRAGTFDPLFPNQTFFSPHPAIYPSNLYSIHPLFTVAQGKLRLEAGCILLWRQSTTDAIYESNASIRAVQGLDRQARTGTQLSVQLEYEIDEQFTTEVVFSRLLAGPAIAQAGGSDVSFFGSTISFRY